MSSNNSSQALKAGVWYIISNIVLRAITVLTAPIFTRLLTPADYGKVNNFFSWQTILTCVFGLCLNYSIARAKIDYENHFDSFISSIQTLSILVGLFILVLALPFIDLLSIFMEIEESFLIVLLAFLIVSPSLDFLQSKYRFEYRYKENVAIAIINTLSVVLISIGLILLCMPDKRYEARILGGVIPVFCLGVFSVIYIFREGKTFINSEYWRYGLKFSLPMIPHGFAMVVLAQIDRIMLVKMAGYEAAGLYSFGYSYAIVISIVTNAIMGAWQPWLYEKVNELKYVEIINSNKQINLLVFFLVLCLILIGPEVIIILGSEAYYEAKWMVAPVIAGSFFQFYYSYFSLMEMYKKRTDVIAYGSVGAACVKIGLNIIFIPHFGYVGAAYSTMIAYALLLAYHWLIYRSLLKIRIFAEKQMLILVLLAVVFTLLLTYTYDIYMLRYFMLLVILVFLGYTYRVQIKLLMKKCFKNEHI